MSRQRASEWKVSFDGPAARDLVRVPEHERDRLLRALDELTKGPFQPSVRKLRGRPEWRLRIGGRRALFLVDQDAKSILVTDIGSRGDIFKDD